MNNPKKAGIANPQNYTWSSFHEYGENDGITDGRMLCDMIGSKKELLAFLGASDQKEFLDDISVKHDDNWAKGIIKRELNVTSGTALQGLPRSERDEMLVKLKNAGLSVRQLERLTGINRGVIQKAKGVK